jgi:hypothetical protein
MGTVMNKTNGAVRKKVWWGLYLLLFLPFVALLCVPFYNRNEPALAGIPFFYWYQMLWIVLGAVLLLPLYFAQEHSAKKE